MTRTNIQLPDDVYARALKVCENQKISLAELARRGIEQMLSVYAAEPVPQEEWQLPEPRHLGWKGLSHTEIKQQAQLTNSELTVLRSPK